MASRRRDSGEASRARGEVLPEERLPSACLDGQVVRMDLLLLSFLIFCSISNPGTFKYSIHIWNGAETHEEDWASVVSKANELHTVLHGIIAHYREVMVMM